MRSASAFLSATRASCSSVKRVFCGTMRCISAHDAHIRCMRFLSPRAMPAPMKASISVFGGCHTWIPASNPPHASPMHGAACSVLCTFSGTHLRAAGKDASCLYVKTPDYLLAQLVGEPHIGAILRSGEAVTRRTGSSPGARRLGRVVAVRGGTMLTLLLALSYTPKIKWWQTEVAVSFNVLADCATTPEV